MGKATWETKSEMGDIIKMYPKATSYLFISFYIYLFIILLTIFPTLYKRRMIELLASNEF